MVVPPPGVGNSTGRSGSIGVMVAAPVTSAAVTDTRPTAKAITAGRPGASGPLLVVASMAAAVVVSHALARSTFPILLPAIETELLTSRSQSGLLSSTNFVAYLVGVAALTTISGRAEPVRLLRIGLAAATAGFGVLAGAGSVAALAVGQALTGFGSAGIWMSAPTIATGATPTSRRGLVMGLLSSAMGLGILLAGLGTGLSRSVADDDSVWRPTWVASAVFAAAILVGVSTVLRVPATEPIAGGVSLRHLRTVPRWTTLATAYFLFGLASSAFTGFFGLLAKDAGFTPDHITNLFSLFGLAAVVGAVNLGRISDRIGRRPVLAFSMVAIGSAAILALVGREPYAAIAIALFGAASFTYPVLTVAYLRDHLTDRAFANALGALTLVYGGALVLGPALAGFVADSSLGLDTVFAALAVVSFLAAATALRLPAGGGESA
jgi:MFS family permease